MFWLTAPCGREDGVPEETVGPVVTVKTLTPVPAPVSGFVTVTSRAPVVAPAATVMFAVRDVSLTNVVELTVIPAPENEATAPATKPVPLIAMFWFAAPWPRCGGVVAVTVGAELGVPELEPLVALQERQTAVTV